MLLHTHNEQKNRCTYNRCCTTNVSVMQRRFLFAAQVFVDDTQPILAAHWVYCRKMFLQPQQRLCLSHVIANHRPATAETLQSFACHCEPVGCCADTLPPSACHCEERGGCTATWQSIFPAEKLGKVVALRANSQLLRIRLKCCYLLCTSAGMRIVPSLRSSQ